MGWTEYGCWDGLQRSSLRQITVVVSDAREKACALNFSGLALGLQGIEISMSRYLSVSRHEALPQERPRPWSCVAWSGAGRALSAPAGSSGWPLANAVIVEKKPRG